MASDLISRDTLKEEMVKDFVNTMRMMEMHKGDMALRVLNKIDEAPAVDAEPVRHGFWNWNLGFPYCSECKKIAHKKGFAGYHTSDYCPNCGAKMDGGKRDAD